MCSEWKENEINFLKKNYKNMTTKEIAESLNRTSTAVHVKASKLGLVKSKYQYNKLFFKNIDTEEKAYWLGFIYADGYVVKGDAYQSELGIELQKSDYEHLKKFNKSINGNLEVKFRKRICNLNNKEYETCLIRLFSKEIVNDLINLGVFPNKSLSIKLPSIDDKLMSHFIRGFFDGDGCVSRTGKNPKKKQYVKADFTCGSSDFVNELREYLYKNNINSYIVRENENKPFRLVIGGMENCDRFLHYMYDNSTIFLDRKYYKKISLYKNLGLEQHLPL